ncbi:MAG: GTP pyrophosphokinase family protein [Lachnospiraceae bacterium]
MRKEKKDIYGDVIEEDTSGNIFVQETEGDTFRDIFDEAAEADNFGNAFYKAVEGDTFGNAFYKSVEGDTIGDIFDDAVKETMEDTVVTYAWDDAETTAISEFREEVMQVCELVPVEVQRENDMERIAEMIDCFSQSMDPILSMYNSAMSVTKSRLEIIQDEFSFRKERSPIHHIDTRLKSAKSILGKLNKKGLDPTLTVACNNIFDIAGIRVVCPYVKDVYMIRDRILAQDDVQIMNIKDYIEKPKTNGYRSLHMTIRVPVYFMNKKQMVPVELQIRTLAMDLWASLEHDIKYKSLYQGLPYDESDVDFDMQLKECSRLIYEAEAKMEAMNRILEG